jgi:hypothetical protein
LTTTALAPVCEIASKLPHNHNFDPGTEMAFYVSYSSATGRSRIHLSSCPRCRDGAVVHDAQALVSWSPILSTLSEAESYALRMFPDFRDRGKCDHCMSGDFMSGPYWLMTLQGWIGDFARPKARLLPRNK